MDEHIEVFVRFILRHGLDEKALKMVMTVAAFLSDDVRISNLARSDDALFSLDDDLAALILMSATPFEASRILWGPVGRRISPRLFLKLFDDLLNSISDINVLWLLTGAMVDFAGFNPGMERTSQLDFERLLASNDADHRTVGLRALSRLTRQTEKLLFEIRRAIQRDDSYEIFGGLYELGRLLNTKGSVLLEASNLSAVRSVIDGLIDLVSSTRDDEVRKNATYHLNTMKDLMGMEESDK